MLQASTILFLRHLKKNNTKTWFDANRKPYEAAKADFTAFIESVIRLHSKKDPTISGLTAKECLFRINRDIRFSKDKSPYKTNFGASINRGGKKAANSAGYYFHLEPGGAFAGGGIYMPEPDMLKKIRQEIDYNLPVFKKLLSAAKFKSIYGQLEQGNEYRLSRVPKGYAADNPAADFLRFKSYIALVNIPDAELTSPGLLKKTVAAFEALQPLIEFMNACTGD